MRAALVVLSAVTPGGELAEAGNTLLVDWHRGVDTFGRECVDLGWLTQ